MSQLIYTGVTTRPTLPQGDAAQISWFSLTPLDISSINPSEMLINQLTHYKSPFVAGEISEIPMEIPELGHGHAPGLVDHHATLRAEAARRRRFGRGRGRLHHAGLDHLKYRNWH